MSTGEEELRVLSAVDLKCVYMVGKGLDAKTVAVLKYATTIVEKVNVENAKLVKFVFIVASSECASFVVDRLCFVNTEGENHAAVTAVAAIFVRMVGRSTTVLSVEVQIFAPTAVD